VKSVLVECQQGYSEEIYNADETGVFYNMMHNSSFKFKGEKCVSGKMSKNRLTVLMCVCEYDWNLQKISLLLENHKHHVVSKT
jgi:hypothetical protein